MALVLSVGIVACSDDDDDNKSNALVGTTWKIMSASEDNGLVGIEITFKSDGTFVMSRDGWTYAKWSLKGETLTLTVGEGMPDDYMKGAISIDGNNASYTYHWGDVEGEWEDEDSYTMTLQKQ